MKWIKTAKTSVNANRYSSHPSLDHNGQQSGESRLAAPSTSFVGRFLRTWANDDFEHQARFARHCDVRPMLADLFQVAFLLVGMLLASEAVEFIQFDVLSQNACNDLLVGGFGLQTGAINPPLNGGRMNAFDAGNRLRAQSFEPFLDGALNLLFRRLKVVEGRSNAVAESLPTLTAAED